VIDFAQNHFFHPPAVILTLYFWFIFVVCSVLCNVICCSVMVRTLRPKSRSTSFTAFFF